MIEAPFKVGDPVRTDFYPRHAKVVRRVVDVRPARHASQTGWFVSVDGPGDLRSSGGLCADAGWFTAAGDDESAKQSDVFAAGEATP